MTSITRQHKIYFTAVGLLALWVGVWGYFIPAHVNQAIPWMVPALHSRFLGGMYFSGTAFMVGCLRAHRWAEVRVVLPMIAIWTGMLFVTSLFYLNEFNFGLPQSWIWFGAYFFYPIIALRLAWQQRTTDMKPAGPIVPKWVSIYLFAQGSLVTALALALLFQPSLMVTVWPWEITPLLAQIYSAPFLSYGLGSLMLSRRQSWLEIRIAVTATWVFAVGVLLASIIHRNLFSASDLSDCIWFVGFSLAVLMLGLITVRSIKSS